MLTRSLRVVVNAVCMNTYGKNLSSFWWKHSYEFFPTFHHKFDELRRLWKTDFFLRIRVERLCSSRTRRRFNQIRFFFDKKIHMNCFQLFTKNLTNLGDFEKPTFPLWFVKNAFVAAVRDDVSTKSGFFLIKKITWIVSNFSP